MTGWCEGVIKFKTTQQPNNNGEGMRWGEKVYEGVGISFVGRRAVWASKSISNMKKRGTSRRDGDMM